MYFSGASSLIADVAVLVVVGDLRVLVLSVWLVFAIHAPVVLVIPDAYYDGVTLL